MKKESKRSRSRDAKRAKNESKNQYKKSSDQAPAKAQNGGGSDKHGRERSTRDGDSHRRRSESPRKKVKLYIREKGRDIKEDEVKHEAQKYTKIYDIYARKKDGCLQTTLVVLGSQRDGVRLREQLVAKRSNWEIEVKEYEPSSAKQEQAPKKRSRSRERTKLTNRTKRS